MGFAARVIASGAAAGLASALVAALFSKAENGHAARPINAVAHITDGGSPPSRDGPSHRNTAVGFATHMAASAWWAVFFEALFGERARHVTRDAVAGGTAIAAAAYVVDYHVVSRRFRPGFERYLSRSAMLALYASLAAGFALSARLSRLHHHQVKDRDEGQERRPAERRPASVVSPEKRRQRRLLAHR